MDLLTHALVGVAIRKINKIRVRLFTVFSTIGATIPDIGEIIIQKRLSEKNKEQFAVYDIRTSDIEVANQIEVTWLYDITHSLFTTFILFAFGYLLLRYTKSTNLYTLSLCILWLGFGQFSHVCLDSFTHGKVWALKLLYPISSHRFLILSESVGNWWEWKPQLTIPFFNFPFPIGCLLLWTILLIFIFIKK